MHNLIVLSMLCGDFVLCIYLAVCCSVVCEHCIFLVNLFVLGLIIFTEFNTTAPRVFDYIYQLNLFLNCTFWHVNANIYI